MRGRRCKRRQRPIRRAIAWIAFLAASAVVAFGAFVYLTLPDVAALKTANPKTTAFIELRERAYRERTGRPARSRQTWIDLERISPTLIDAVLITEDAGFYHHGGVDYHELWESIKLNWRDQSVKRGASTITQQLAKNLYLSPDRSFVRKFRELLIARRLERDLPKRRILELYLNVVEWGEHLYGIEEAARRYYHVSAADLNAAESATLAGMLINPIRYTPLTPSKRLARRQRIILDKLVKYGRISREEYRAARGLDAPAQASITAETDEDAVDDEGVEDVAPKTLVLPDEPREAVGPRPHLE